MELSQQSIGNTQQFGKILENKQNQTLAFAQKTVKDIVDTEMSLFNFELMMGLNINKTENKRLTRISKKLRRDTYKELKKESNNNFEKMNEILNEI